VTLTFFFFYVHIYGGWNFYDEEKCSLSATITRLFISFFCLFFSRRMTLFTRISTLQIDRLTIVLIRINIATAHAYVYICVPFFKTNVYMYVAVQWLLFDERKEKREGRAVAVQEFISSITHLSHRRFNNNNISLWTKDVCWHTYKKKFTFYVSKEYLFEYKYSRSKNEIGV
jgi:hypothetical protein